MHYLKHKLQNKNLNWTSNVEKTRIQVRENDGKMEANVAGEGLGREVIENLLLTVWEVQ